MNIGLQEIMLISVIALIVLGPERLPTAIRTLAIWLNRFKRSFNELKATIEDEIDAEGIRREIHNDNIMRELEQARDALDQLDQPVNSKNEDKKNVPTRDSTPAQN